MVETVTLDWTISGFAEGVDNEVRDVDNDPFDIAYLASNIDKTAL